MSNKIFPDSLILPANKALEFRRLKFDSFDEQQKPETVIQPEVIPDEEDLPFSEEEDQDFPEEAEDADFADLAAMPEMLYPTAAELDEIHQEAYQSGYDAGLEEGRAIGQEQGFDLGKKEGFSQGLEEGRAQAEEEVALFKSISEEFIGALRVVEHEMSQHTLILALEVARHVLRQQLAIKPELLIPVVRQAIASLPHVGEHPRLFVHPNDLQIVETFLSKEHALEAWQLIEDETLSRGGCRIETGTGEVDLDISTRWKRVVSSLGHDIPWNDPPQFSIPSPPPSVVSPSAIPFSANDAES